jgi:hypothetical protein
LGQLQQLPVMVIRVRPSSYAELDRNIHDHFQLTRSRRRCWHRQRLEQARAYVWRRAGNRRVGLLLFGQGRRPRVVVTGFGGLFGQGVSPFIGLLGLEGV